MPTATANTLVDILLAQGALDAKKAEQVKLSEIQTGASQEDILKEKKLVNEKALAQAKASFYNIPYVDLTASPASPEALALLSQDVAERFKVFPIALDKTAKELVLAMADPLDLTAIEFIEKKTGFRVKPAASEPSTIEEFASTRYASSLSKEVSEAVEEISPKKEQIKPADKLKGGFIREEKIRSFLPRKFHFLCKQ